MSIKKPQKKVINSNKIKKKTGLWSKMKTWPILKKFGNPDPVIAVVQLKGVIGQASAFKSGLTMAGVAHQLTEAFEMEKTKAVALIINSPGGSPVQSSLIGKRIRALAKEHKKKVFTFVEDVAASGGYWLACTGDEIYADESSIIGSIGVISAGFGFPALLKKHGVERRVYTSGKSKSVLDPFQPEKAADIQKLKNLQEDVHAHFIKWVKSSRDKKLKEKDSVLFTGEFWAGETAMKYGLIDGIGDLRSTCQEKFGKKVKFKMIKDDTPWWKRKPQIGVSEEKLAKAFGAELENLAENYEIKNRFKIG